jgi:hypothetical protein
MFRLLMGRWVTDRESRQRDQHAALLALVGLLGSLFTALCLVMSQFQGVAGAIGLGGLILFASASGGAALGFLFSVPRVLSSGDEKAAETGAPTDSNARRLLSSNTNLERISEWLTTMIVGVGLSQITSVAAHIEAFTAFLAARSTPNLAAAGPFILMVGVVSGFVFLYLYTRLYLSPLFLHVERLISQIGQQALPLATEEVRSIAKELAAKDGGSVMKFIANVDQITLDQTLHVMGALLYEEGGYQRVLKLGEDLEDTPAAEMARFWYLLAAANGQRYHNLVERSASEEEKMQARRAVLDAGRKAVTLDPSFKRRLAALTNKNTTDNDLQDFANDAEFQRLVGGRVP